MILDESAKGVEVWVLESMGLAAHWRRLDDFEGPGYRRTTVAVTTDRGELTAFVYVLAGR